MNTKKQTFFIASAMKAIERNSMQKLLYAIFFLGICVSPAFAQSSHDYNKVELYGGFSHARVRPDTKTIAVFGEELSPCSNEATPILGENFQTSFCRRAGFNGFDASVTYNFNRYVGIKGNVTGHYKSESFTDNVFGTTQTIDTRKRIHNFLAGVQVKDNLKTKRFKPFAHALVGAATYSFRGINTGEFPEDNYTLRSKVTSFAMKIGGGIDVRVNRRIDLRLFEANYNPIFARDYEVTGFPASTVTQKSKLSHNFTLGFGIAFH